MESIVFFGKGGIGKSTIATNVAVLLSASGRKVLHVGCDPKRDSTLSLTGRRIRPFSDQNGSAGETALRAAIHRGVKGVDCIEAGGPQAGVGCAGAGIGAMLDALKNSGLLQANGYDTVIFDVLGDVVCGGFAAPLRRGFTSKAVLVVSEELLSLYAANNLIAMVNNYARNGVFLAGLAVNAKDISAVKLANDFARAANTRVLGVIPRDPAIARAEKLRRPVVVFEPGSQAAKSLAGLTREIAFSVKPASPPQMLGEAEFEAFMGGRAAGSGAVPAAGAHGGGAGAAPSPADLLARSGFGMTGLLGGQVVCTWKSGADVFKLFVAPVAGAKPGMTVAGDWAYCFAPGGGPGPGSDRSGFDLAVKAVSGLLFEDFVSAFNGTLEFYGNVDSFGRTGYHPRLPEGDRPIDQHTGFGQWQRFIFSDNSGICVPPGAVMVEHADNECRFSSCSSTPLNTFQKMGGLANDSRPSLAPFLPKEDANVMNTDFVCGDAIKGDEKKIAVKLTAAAARAGAGGLVEFYTGCSPLLLASDTAAFTDRTARDLGVEVLRDNFNNFDESTPEKVKARSALVVRRLKALRRTKPSADLNLINFGDTKAEPLARLLAARGLSVTPHERDFYGDIAAARLQVLSYADPVLTSAFDRLGIKWVSPAAPYGLAATRAWLRALFAALGRKAPKAGLAPSREEAAAHAALARQLSRCAAGFIASPDEFPMLEGSWSVSGVPMISFLAEAGLAVRLFAYAPDAAARSLAKKETALLAGRTGTRLRLECFDSPGGLEKALAKDRALRLVYSDIPQDARLAAAGKNAFSATMCEPGYEGAVETLRRLARLSQWDFN